MTSTSSTMNLLLVLASVLSVLVANGEVLQISLEPALNYHAALVDRPEHYASKILFRPVSPQVQDESCQEECICLEVNEPCCRINCGATIPSINLCLYSGIEFQFKAPDGKEIQLASGTYRYMSFNVVSKSASCIDRDMLNRRESRINLDILGSDGDALLEDYYPEDSYVLATSCEISTRLVLGSQNPTKTIKGTISEIRWSIPFSADWSFNNESQDYVYNTDDRSGGSIYILSPFDGSIVAASSNATAFEDSTDAARSSATRKCFHVMSGTVLLAAVSFIGFW